MLAIHSSDLRRESVSIFEKVAAGETVIITRPKRKNIVMLSEKEYNKLERSARNFAYWEKIQSSMRQLEEGHIVEKTLEELEEMAR
ncbi:MAG: type II toxin-antitoxin system Phd/YefM family antitoxin [Actinomycetes bacterium]|jgi:PHD/YefM family antitoxin component YafN of YafNO toxin-antitoxin module|nr:type II toxin-antitoxin system Phd/YefM family antitoxin [Actinomycetes bacterium]